MISNLNSLCLVRPNPFNAKVDLSFNLELAAEVSFEFVDVRGRRVGEVTLGSQPPGPISYSWDGRDIYGGVLASGLYFVVIKAGGETIVEKVTLVK